MTIQASNNEDDFETMRTDTLRSIASAIADLEAARALVPEAVAYMRGVESLTGIIANHAEKVARALSWSGDGAPNLNL